jgi:hypothetical protein
MNRFLLVSVLAFLMTWMSASGQEVRSKLNINREWKFVLEDAKGAESPNYNDVQWDDVSLPHSFSIPYFMWSKVYTGYGWYRKVIDIPASWHDKNVTLEFEGAFIESEVFVNGSFVGKHVGGYTGFYFDITKFLLKGKNTIAVRVNNLWRPNVAPRAGDHQFSGGIYRDVYLNITDKLHVDVNGTFIYTFDVSKASALCHASTEVRNNYAMAKTVTIRTEIMSPSGNVVATAETSAQVGAAQVVQVSQDFAPIVKPLLWSPETPSLYKAVTTLVVDGGVADQFETTFGIRSFVWTSDKGFFLNGEHYYLLGANVHQDQAGWGDAVTNAALRRDVQMMKDAGFNCIRGSHYPHDPSFSQACDEIGMILFQENAFWGMGGSTGDKGWGAPSSSCYPPNAADWDGFDQSVLSQLKEMIKTHRNHASIAAWSLSNEPFFTDASTDEPMKRLLNTATDSARAWDPSRLVAIGGAQRKGVDRLGKGAIAFYNGDGASREEFQNPGVPSLVSEYGSFTSHRPGRFFAGWGDIKDGNLRLSWRSGHVIWCGFDHGTVGGVGLATMGLIDYFRIPKRQYYWYVEAYTKGVSDPVEPQWAQDGTPAKLKLEASNYTITATDGTDDTQLIITVVDALGEPISRNVPVELVIVSGPGEFPTGRSIRFMPPSDKEESDITIRDGQAGIALRSYHGGKTIVRATAEGLEPATIEINTLGLPEWRDGLTKPVPERPYTRFVVEKAGHILDDEEHLLLALNRPCWSSSDIANKVKVNDWDVATVWIPAKIDTDKWWKLHLEAAYSIDVIQVELPEESNEYAYIIEFSSDGINWQRIIDEYANKNDSKIRTYRGSFGSNIAFLRVKFLSVKAGLAEIRIGGKPSNAE